MPLSPNAPEMMRPVTDRNTPVNPIEDKVVLVNRQDEAIGVEDNTRAHLVRLLHRAFSVFVINAGGHLLLQKRAVTKYHSRGLWSNTCCSHPRPDESVEDAARRRPREERGFDTELSEVCHFIYRAELEDGLVENEYDHVLVGSFDGVPQPDTVEVAEWRCIDLAKLGVDLKNHPERRPTMRP